MSNMCYRINLINKKNIYCRAKIHQIKRSWRSADRTVYIGVSHLLYMIYGIHCQVYDMGMEGSNTTDEVIQVILFYVVHALLAGLLIIGAVKKIAWLLLPWLLCGFPVCTIVTFYTLETLSVQTFSSGLFNLVFTSFIWFLWISVLRCYCHYKRRLLWQKHKNNTQNNIECFVCLNSCENVI